MVKVKCRFCQHEWDYIGKQFTSKCPKCFKHVNIKKGVILYRGLHPDDASAQLQDLTSADQMLGVEMPEEKMDPVKVSDTSINVEQVNVSVPPELQKPEIIKDIKDAKNTAAAAKQVEIPYRTVEIFCELPFNTWASMEKDDAYKLEKTERDSLVPFIKQYLDKHMGDWFKGYSDEIAMAIVLGLIVVKRIAYKAKKAQVQREKKSSSSNSPPASGEVSGAASSPAEKPEWLGGS